MNEQTRQRVQQIADRIADDQPVDWEVESGDTDAGQRCLANLRALEAIGTVHRGRDSSRTTRVARPADRDDESAPAMRATSWGTLELVELIGRGGYGSVYRAWDPGLKTDVALKLCPADRETPDEFLREARQLAKVRHENVVTVHGVRIRDDQVGLWMELIRGKDLEATLQAQGPFSAQEAVAIGTKVLHALAAVHVAGLVHRDIKAANVMREDGSGRIVLMDFSTTVEPSPRGEAAGRDSFVGTVQYMAPEIFEGDPGSQVTALMGCGHKENSRGFLPHATAKDLGIGERGIALQQR